MLFETLRFGNMDIPQDKIITMARPILGFENLKSFCIVESEEMSPFMWLQSLEEPSVAFIVVNPRLFVPDYAIEVNRKEIADLEIQDIEAVETYVIVTVPENPREMSANLQGPVLINTGNNLARQLVMVNSEYNVIHHLLDSTDTVETARSPVATESVTV